MNLAAQAYRLFSEVEQIMEIELKRFTYKDVRKMQEQKDTIDLERTGRMPYTKAMRERWGYEINVEGPNDDQYIARRKWKDGTVIERPDKIEIDSTGFRL